MEECKFCRLKNPKTLLSGKAPYTTAWVKIFVNINDVRLGLNARGDDDISKSVKINYCPVCGRSFNN